LYTQTKSSKNLITDHARQQPLIRVKIAILFAHRYNMSTLRINLSIPYFTSQNPSQSHSSLRQRGGV
ncbi:MAG: hypothetical protein LBC41_07280, partial [Clostridiales bacterium]|nr:hypothetical protein [Clostridiales bacterium]